MLRLVSFARVPRDLVDRGAVRRRDQAAGAACGARRDDGGSKFRRAVRQSRRDAGARGLAFTLAMTLGAAIGYLMGRVRLADRLGDPWLILLLNLPALVVIVLAYIWAGLTEVAAIAAIAINKLPTAVVTLREGTRALDRSLDEMATVFAIPRWQSVPARGAAAACALYRRRRALGTFAGLEDRAGGGTAGTPERRRLRDRRGLPAVRHPASAGLFADLRRGRARHRNRAGAAV